jgi:hypothetical protein
MKGEAVREIIHIEGWVMRSVGRWGGLVLVGIALIGCLTTNTSLSKGRPARDIQGSDAEGQPLRLSDYRGKVVLLDFWASY